MFLWVVLFFVNIWFPQIAHLVKEDTERNSNAPTKNLVPFERIAANQHKSKSRAYFRSRLDLLVSSGNAPIYWFAQPDANKIFVTTFKMILTFSMVCNFFRVTNLNFNKYCKRNFGIEVMMLHDRSFWLDFLSYLALLLVHSYVLLQRFDSSISALEWLLFVWIIALSGNEVLEVRNAIKVESHCQSFFI